MATEKELAADALEWSKSFARDARSCHAVNHDHDCTETCVKKAKKIEGTQASWQCNSTLQIPFFPRDSDADGGWRAQSVAIWESARAETVRV